MAEGGRGGRWRASSPAAAPAAGSDTDGAAVVVAGVEIVRLLDAVGSEAEEEEGTSRP